MAKLLIRRNRHLERPAWPACVLQTLPAPEGIGSVRSLGEAFLFAAQPQDVILHICVVCKNHLAAPVGRN